MAEGGFTRAHPEPQIQEWGACRRNKPRKQPNPALCPINQAAPWLISLIIINFFHVLPHILLEERRGDARVFLQDAALKHLHVLLPAQHPKGCSGKRARGRGWPW